MKDSKKFHSKEKINEVAEYIQSNAIAWSVQFVEHDVIDKINIRQSVFQCMHACIEDIQSKLPVLKEKERDVLLLVDGTDFKPYSRYNNETEDFITLRHETVEGGDNKYTAIAAASILAKVARDQYIAEMCEQYPDLDTFYSLSTNMGYGTKAHLEGIAKHGLSEWHRRSYKISRLPKISAENV
jgi:ribonuclease HII